MIGITERGDAGIDLSWANQLYTVNGAILITKDCNEKFRNTVINAMNLGHKLIVHATCTGFGGTAIELNVPDYETQLHNVESLINMGFPKENIVLRIDPLIPCFLTNAENVINKALEMGLLPDMTVRISVMDMYNHTRQRFAEANINTFYTGFQASKLDMEAIDSWLLNHKTENGIRFVSCAEPNLTVPERVGCVSKEDLNKLGLPVTNTRINPQNRRGCLCIAEKTELLSARQRCPHQCLYCYWKDR